MRSFRLILGCCLALASAAVGIGDEPVVDPVLDRLERQERELRALRTEIDTLSKSSMQDTGDSTSAPKAQPDAAPLLAGYDQGFFIHDADDRFRIHINSWFQVRHAYFDSDGPNRDENGFEFERVRLAFRGHALTRDLTYFLQLDGDTDQGGTVDLLDYYTMYDIGHDALGCEPGRLGIRLGQWKLPFQRARAEAGTKLQFADRSPTSEFFDINRSVGLSLYGADDVFAWETALFNGFNTQGLLSSRAGDVDHNLAASGRLTALLFGEWDAEGEPDLVPNACPAMQVGIGVAHSRVDIEEGFREFARFRTNDTGAAIASLLPPGTTEFAATLYTVDSHFKFRGLSFIADYYFRQITDFNGAAIPNLYDHGFLLQSGYMLVPERLEAIARWSRVVGDSSTLGRENRSFDEVAGGLVWYIRKHDAKLVFDVSHVNGAPVDSATLNLQPGDVGWLYRTQFQVSF